MPTASAGVRTLLIALIRIAQVYRHPAPIHKPITSPAPAASRYLIYCPVSADARIPLASERHLDMKITDLKVWVTQPEPRGRSFVFLRIDTDEGISGVGEATGSGVRQN